MKMSKVPCLTLALVIALAGPLPLLAQAQEEQPKTEAVTTESQSPLASILTAVNIPARGGLCLLAGFMGGFVMVFSGGRRYTDAAQMMEEGCSGPWIITPEMIDRGGTKQKDMSNGTSVEDKQP